MPNNITTVIVPKTLEDRIIIEQKLKKLQVLDPSWTTEKRKEMLKKYKTDQITFQNLIPMHRGLDFLTSSSTIKEINIAKYGTFTKGSYLEKRLEIFLDKNPDSELRTINAIDDYLHNSGFGISDDSTYKLLYEISCTMNMILFGVPDWHKWGIQNWGTKWDAYDSKLETLTFVTAWNTPLQIFKELAKYASFTITAYEEFSNYKKKPDEFIHREEFIKVEEV